MTTSGQQPAQPPRLLAKHQPCGCIVCTCEDDLRCHGCGAKNCGTHPVGQIPNAVYERQPAQPGSGEVKRYVGRITELEPCPVQYVVLASDFDRLQSALTEAQQTIACLPADWRKDSSLETWFPFTAKELTAAQQRIAELEHQLAVRSVS